MANSEPGSWSWEQFEPSWSLDASGTGQNEPGTGLSIPRTGKAFLGSAEVPRN
jgi:hypothetical protein